MTTPDDECPHGFPPRYVKRCADCRKARRRAEEAAKFKALLAQRATRTLLPDAAQLAANDRGEP